MAPLRCLTRTPISLSPKSVVSQPCTCSPNVGAIQTRLTFSRTLVDEILEDQFNSWYQEPALWPQDRGIESFQRWFSISFHSMIVDLCDDPLVAEEC